ncbi:MAG TPA: Ldh family oxidoreductase [Candidatus Bilophila faecipullorum]|uniref:Ldh family oxidoreductase n=6 Tax=Bilophila TaxID=35832 RepID=A0A9D1QY41_9BACT|nr:Ldh family oxidoreductase [uncultured Bilophila sp.]HIW78186.1 Ldh family oxidoreductase [Candidatus Bilophila faecipullorum]
MILDAVQLRDLGMAVFAAAGVPEAAAASVVDALVLAELDGLPSHGFSRIPFYTDQALSGKVNAAAVPQVSTPAPASVLVDAGNGFAFPAIQAGLERAVPLAKRYGVAVLGVTRSHHCGVVGLYAERLAGEGLLSLIFSNTPAAMAPWGGSRASFGTNPLAFGCPREGRHPLVIDLSLSKVARGKIMAARQRGESIPEGWALDAQGRPATDPAAALGGTMIPVGDAKGSALALMVEILAAALTGANYAFEASSFFEAEGPAPGIGQTFILIDPAPLNPGFAPRLEALCGQMLAQEGVRLPGERRFALRERNRQAGVNLPDALYADLRKRAKLA